MRALLLGETLECAATGAVPAQERPIETPALFSRAGVRTRQDWRRGRDSNPGYGGHPHNGFQDRRIQPLCHPSERKRDDRTAEGHGHRGRPGSTLSRPGRGGREAEGTRLLSEYGAKSPSRVRIPPSPLPAAPLAVRRARRLADFPRRSLRRLVLAGIAFIDTWRPTVRPLRHSLRRIARQVDRPRC